MLSGPADQQTRDDGMALAGGVGHPRAASGALTRSEQCQSSHIHGWERPLVAAFAAAARPSPPDASSPGRCESAYIKAQPPTFLSMLEFLILVLAPPGKPYTPLPARLPPPPSLSPPGRPQKSADISYFAAFACWSENLVITRRFSKEVSRQNQQEEKTFSS